MALETQPRDAAETLSTPADVAAYLDTYLEDGTQEEGLRAFNTVARSKGMSALARDGDQSRGALQGVQRQRKPGARHAAAGVEGLRCAPGRGGVTRRRGEMDPTWRDGPGTGNRLAVTDP